jgi:adenosine deaminase
MTRALPASFARLPKIELHLHLDCSLSLEAIRQLVPGMTEAHYRAEFLAPRKCKNLVDYFRYLAAPLALLHTRKGLQVAAIDLMRQLAEDGVIYAEIRFAPHLHRHEGLSTDEVVETVLEALAEGAQLYPVTARLLLCSLRPDGTSQGLDLVRLVAKYSNDGVGGLDLAGDEAGYSLDQHIPVFRAAAERGLNVTAHAGEAAGPESVSAVITQLGVGRVGHGVRAIENDRVIDLILERRVHLEVCPSCNIQIDVFDRYEDHPIDKLMRRGVSLSVNTDARGPTDLTLTEEYQRLHEVFGWGETEFRKANLAAIDKAFVCGDIKARLREAIVASAATGRGRSRSGREDPPAN